MKAAFDARNADIIALDDPGAVRHFTRVLGCNERQLREAVHAVGPHLANVRMRFRRRPMVHHHRAR